MTISQPVAVPPGPGTPQSYDDVAAGLQDLRAWAGVSYRELHRRVVRKRRRTETPEQPAYDTVYRALQPGRTRVDLELVADISAALGGDPALWRQACQAVGRRRARSVVAVTDLPAGVPPTVGRAEQRAALVRHLARPGAVGTVVGMPGVGKTALAMDVTQLLLRNGGLTFGGYVNLAGFDPDREPADRESVLAGLLRYAGVPADRIAPADDNRRRALLAEAWSDRDVLIVLDNAADAAQVRPLLVTGGGLRFLVTSRRRLKLSGASLVSLDELDPAASARLLAAVSGQPELATADPVTDLAELSGHLPLALVLLGRRIARQPDWTLGDHVEQLRELRRQHRLDAPLQAGLRLSYAGLSREVQLLGRHLALHAGPDVAVATAAVLAGSGLVEAEAGLAELEAASMIRRSGPSRWVLHDLVITFLVARCTEETPPRVRRQAQDRLWDHQAAWTAAAMAAAAPQEAGTQPAVPAVEVAPATDLSDAVSARQWLDAEYPNLLAGALAAADHGRTDHTARIAFLLFDFMLTGAYVDDAVRLFGLVAEVSTGHDQARALVCLGAALAESGRLDKSRDVLVRARVWYEAAGLLVGLANVTNNLGAVCRLLGDLAGAETSIRESLRYTLMSGATDRGIAAHNNLGDILRRLGRLDEAAEHHEQALADCRDLGARLAEGRTLADLAAVHLEADRPDLARGLAEDALRIAGEVQHPLTEALARNVLAGVASRSGDHATALAGHEHALALAGPLGHLDTAEEIRGSLAASRRRAGLG